MGARRIDVRIGARAPGVGPLGRQVDWVLAGERGRGEKGNGPAPPCHSRPNG